MNTRTTFFMLALFGSVACHAQTPAAAIQGCVACHGDSGVASQPKTPHLNGQLPLFLSEAMKSFAAGSRPTAIAEHKMFPAGEREAMAAFYAGQKAVPRPKQATDAALVAKGESIYGNRCADCHVDGGRESDKDAPLMAAQNKEFLVGQALLFKSGARKFPFMMDDSYRGLSDADLAAVAEYFAAQEQFSVAGEKKKRRR
jgi:cytochrome c553